MSASLARRDRLDRLGRERFDVLVVGGGIVGAAIARDAALRGFDVALVEKGDFASGTSSKTSKLVHGGLRYLEQGHVGLVRESLRERGTLLRIAPGLVEPLPLLLPILEGDRPPWQVALGLWAYDFLARGRALDAHRMLTREEALRLEPALSPKGLRAAALYSDARMDDARLCLETALDAARAGAVCLNHAAVLDLAPAAGPLEGATVEDAPTGRRVDVRVRVVVNATGPWGDALRRRSAGEVAPRLAPTKGVHLVLPRVSTQALFVRSPEDGRRVFVLPWEGHSLVGTTESPADDLDDLRVRADEVDYLLRVVSRTCPGARAGREDVVATFAGARPLLGFAGGSATRASREHAIEVDARGLVSVLGGKYTTHRAMAEQAVDVVARRLGRRRRPATTARRRLREPGDDVAVTAPRVFAAASERLSPARLARVLSRYGAAAGDVLRLVAEDPALAEPVCAHHDAPLAEVAHGVRSEMATTIEDLLLRRTKLGYSRCRAVCALPALSDLLVREAGLPADAVAIQARAWAGATAWID
jgi:glycerol-3-phosphate dehydrogenase